MNGKPEAKANVTVRTYGSGGPAIVVVHGGPGAPGYMAPVCRRLSGSFTVLEPYQRRSGTAPLAVAQHVSDLRGVMEQRCADGPATFVGHSWGAMLVLAFAAEHLDMVRSLVLVGCGTFDVRSRRTFEAAVERRLTPTVRARLQRLQRVAGDADAGMCAVGRLLEGVYSCDPIAHRDETEFYDSRGYAESWDDMVRLQNAGVYPARFSRITAPVLMLHGDEDPHPGREICASLQAAVPHIEYVELTHCGHYP